MFENTEARGRHHGVHQGFDGSDRPFHKPWMRIGSVTGHAAEITTVHAHYYIISTGRISNERGVTFLFRWFKEIGRVHICVFSNTRVMTLRQTHMKINAR